MTLFDLLKQYSTLDELPRFANRQGVASLLYNEVVGSGDNPFDKSGLIRLSGYAQKQAKKWDIQRDSIASVAKFCKKNGVKMMIFKGYALSLLFENPESRKSGDVDVWFFADGQQTMIPMGENVDELLRAKGVNVVKTVEKHTVFDIKGTHYENHRFFLDSDDHERLMAVEEYLQKTLSGSPLNGEGMVQSDEWENVMYPSANFNAVYLPLHAARHFIYSSASFKQLVDWPIFLQRCGRNVDWSVVYALANKAGYRKWLDVLNAIAVDKFDVGMECIGGQAHYCPNINLEEKVIRSFIVNKDVDNHAPFLKLFALKSTKQFKNRWKINLVYNDNFWFSYVKHSFGYIKRKIRKRITKI